MSIFELIKGKTIAEIESKASATTDATTDATAPTKKGLTVAQIIDACEEIETHTLTGSTLDFTIDLT